MVVAKTWLYKNKFDGYPKESDFELVDEALPPIQDGEFLCENVALSVDPYMRYFATTLSLGSKMVGGGATRIIESKNSNFPVGTLMTTFNGWTSHFIANDDLLKDGRSKVCKINVDEESHLLGVYGLTGLTAYFGFLEVCQPKEGETLFVNTAAGAVGSVVGQIGKIKGLRVVGCAGSDEKVKYLKELGFDGAFNYKTEDVAGKLKELCPNGIDCFFDNVGGKMFDTVLTLMNRLGRASVCGSISIYNEKDRSKCLGPYVHTNIIHKEITIRGFMAPTYYHRYDEGIAQLNAWVKEGKLKTKEHVFHGIENMVKAFLCLFDGANTGKVVVRRN